jgi:hypothetical protein
MMNAAVLWTITLRIFHQILTLWADPKKTDRIDIPFVRMALTVTGSDKNLVVTRPITSLF